jgi:hypothetical protein
MDAATFKDILGPQGTCCALEGNYVWDMYLYVIFFFQIILFALLFSSTLRDTIAVGVTIMSAIADKTYIFGYLEFDDKAYAIWYHTQEAFLTWVVRVAMFAIPLILVTQIKSKTKAEAKLKTPAKFLSAVLFVISLVYTGGRWAFQQRVAGQGDFTGPRGPDVHHYHEYAQVMQASLTFLAMGYLVVKRYWATRDNP